MRKVDTNKKFYVTSKQAREFNRVELAEKLKDGSKKYSSVAEYRKELKRVIKECAEKFDGKVGAPAQLKFFTKCLYELGFTIENEVMRYNPSKGILIRKDMPKTSPNQIGKVIEKYIATSETPTTKTKTLDLLKQSNN